MAKALIAPDCGSCWLVALLCALALGCNNATHSGGHDDELPPPRTTTTVVPTGTTPPPTTMMMMAGSESPVRSPAVDVIPPGSRETSRMPCISCGISCRNCGGGCACDPGGIPDHDEWRSPFRDNGDDGWKDSTAPLCSGLDTVAGSDIARDGGTVYVMVHGSDQTADQIDPTDADGGTVREMQPFSVQQTMPVDVTRVLQNDGNGWTLRADLTGMDAGQRLARIGSALLIYGNLWQGRSGPCTLGTLSGHRFSCENPGDVQDVHAVNHSEAYALVDTTRVLAFDGVSWQTAAEAPGNAANSLWSDGREIVLGTNNGLIGRRSVDPSSTWTFDDAGIVATPVTALWGASRDDLWAGDGVSRLWHFDGERWSQIADLHEGSSCSARAPIVGIAGAGSNVWAYTASQLARWNGEELETFGNWTCAAMEGASGERIDRVVSGGGDELFIAISNTLVPRSCGAAYIVHYDGQRFHRF